MGIFPHTDRARSNVSAPNLFSSMWMRWLAAMGLILLTHGLSTTRAFAEGSFQMGLEQIMIDIPVGSTNRFIKVDITNAGEVINLNACGAADANNIQFTIFDNNLLQVNQGTTAGGTVTCNSAMNTNLTNSYQYTPPNAGTYYVSIDDVSGTTLNRYDVTVTSNAAINPDPTGATGITGRVSAELWEFNTGTYAESSATDADYYILTPGGFPNTNYVWELNLNNFAGFAYDLKANNRGVDAPNSGFSTPRGGNAVTQLFPLYINYPEVAGPTPAQGAAVSGFRFVDEDGQDNSISPGGTVGVQDTGVFEFTTNATNATYAIYIDLNQDGIYGNAGDVQLNGEAANGFNSIFFDGNDNNGAPLPEGSYNAQLGVRLGEFHFIANDAETSGGGAAATGNGDGLTVWQATPGGNIATEVYWDDVTVLGAGAGGTSTVPSGELSGTPGAFHTWGNFTSNGFGNNRFIDTYVFGNTTFATFEVNVTNNDSFTTATVDITDTSTPGDALTLTVTDGDQNANAAAVEIVSVSVVNDVTGETETVTLSETGVDTGIFTSTLPTTFGATAGADNNGNMTTQNGDTVTVTYMDANDTFGNPATPTDTDTVTGGADGAVTITPTSQPGDTLNLTVTDTDLAGNGTLTVSVTNPNSGETETITLTENGGTPGLFEGTVDTAFGIVAGPAADGSLNTQNGDTVVVSYTDALNAAGGSEVRTATDNVSGGTSGTVFITPTSIPGDTLSISVNDADEIGSGTLTVSLNNPVNGETESVTLTESGTTPGLFENTINTTFGTTAGTNDDGTFNTQSGDSIIVTYNDTNTASGGAANLTATDNVSGGTTGVVTIDPTSQPGDTVAISVNDADLAGDGTLDVTVVNTVTGESETVTLTESGTTPGLFNGTVATTFGATAGTDNDGTFNTQNADSLVVTYNDALTASGGTAAPTDTNNVSAGTDGTVSITPTSNPGDTLTISVNDPDLSGDGTLVVSVTNPNTGEIETVTLTESGTTPGLFNGTVTTVFGTMAGTDNDGTFNTQNGDTVVVTYNDALTSSGGTANPTATDNVSGGVNGTVTVTPESIPGGTLTISVSDTDLTGDGALTVTATNPVTGETETLNLTESGVTPGLFEGTVATTFGTTAGTDNDGTFSTQSADTIIVSYDDALTTTGGTNTVTATDNVLGLAVTKTGTLDDGGDGVANVGDQIDYTFTTTNPSAVTLSNVSITDPLVTVMGGPLVTLGAGNTDTTTFTATYTLTQTDLDNGRFTNTATGSGTSPSGVMVSGASDDPANPANADPDGDGIPSDPTVTSLGANGSIAITKTGTVDMGADGVLNVNDVINYTFTVTNTGNVTLTNVSVTDPLATVSGGPITTLNVGANDTTTFTASYTLTQADLDNGSFTNTATVSGTPPGGGTVTGVSDDPTNATNADPDGDGNPSDPTVTPLGGVSSLAITKIGTVDTGADGVLNAGDTINYAFSLTNTGNVTLTNLTVTDPLATVSGGPLASLSPTSTDMTTFTASYVITQVDLDTGSFTNTATASGTPPGGGTVTGVSDDPTDATNADPDGDGNPSDPTVTSLGANPSLALTKVGTVDLGADGVLNVNDTIDYAFTVTNSGNVTLTNVSVNDPLVTVSGGPVATLNVGANDTTTFTATYTITQADLDNGGVTNTATVTGTLPSGGTVTGVSDDPNNLANNDPDGDGNPSDPTVTTLGATASMAVSKVGTVDSGADGVLNAGDTINYTFSVTNTGNVSLNNISVSDPLVSVTGGPLATLGVSASDTTTFTASYTITQADINSGGVTNTATANASTPGGDPVTAVSDDPTNTADVDPDGDGNPSDPTITTLDAVETIAITKTGTVDTGVDGILNAGDTINYAFIVTNTGNVELTNIAVIDPLVSVSGGPLATLAPGANDTTTFTASYIITQADLDNGGVTNTATVTGTTPGGDTATGVSDDPTNPTDADPDGDGNPSDPTVTTLNGNASLAIVKSGSVNVGADGILNVGDTIDYFFTVTNTGTVSLTNVSVSDPLVTVSGGPLATLAPGVTNNTTFTASYAITQADLDAGGVTNTATANGTGPGGAPITGVSDDPNNLTNADSDGDGNPSDPTVTTLSPMGSMNVEKTGALNDGGDGFADPGDTIVYNFAVRNTGNVTLNNISITDALVTVTGGPLAALAPGAIDATTFSAIYTLTDADLQNGSVTNTATANGTTPGGDPVTAVSDDPTNATNDDPDGDGNPSDPTVTTFPTDFPPVAEDDSSATQIGSPVAVPVFANDTDPENGGLTIAGVTQGTKGSVTFQPDGTVIYTPNPGYVGTDTFTYTACDARNQCDTATVTITVDDDTPTASADAAGTEPGTPVTLAVLTNDTDPDNDPLTVTNATVPDNGTATVNPDGTITYTPNPSFIGTDTFIYTICDALNYCDTATVSVTVSPDRPQAMDDTGTTPSGTPLIMDVADNDTDPNGDTLSVSTVTQPANGTVTINPDGTVTYTPDAGYIGIDIFTYTICDTSGNCDTATATLDVTNQIPTVVDDSVSTEEDTAVTIPVVANDNDPEGPLTLTAFTPPSNGSVVINPDGTLTYTPDSGYFGTDTFTYTVCDSSNVCVDGTVTVTITPEVPVLTDDMAVAEPAIPVIVPVLVNDTDPNGDPLTVTTITQPTGGTAVINPDNTVTVTPDSDFEGTLVFVYTACDDADNCDTANLTVEVEAVSPKAEVDVISTPYDTPVTLDPRDNDTDPNGDALTVTAVSVPDGNGTAVINPDGTVTITPEPGHEGDIIVIYDVCDADGNCDTAEINVTVEMPVANVNGIVFLDVNGDDSRQPSEPLESGWTVEIVNDSGDVIASTTTDSSGFYAIDNIPVGSTNVRFRNPDTNVLYGTIENVELNPGLTTIDQNLPIDPSGVVYDSLTRLPIANVTMNFVAMDGTPLPSVCFVDPLQQGQMTDPDGMYRFDLVPGADAACPTVETEYRITFDPPGSHNDGASNVIEGMAMPLNPPAGIGPFSVAPQAMAPMGADPTTYYLSFILAPGDSDVINNHIPLDPVSVMRAPLQVTKTTPRTTISFGDIVPYTITVTNTEAVTRFNLDFVDIAPPGFKYVAQSARVDGVAETPVVVGREITFENRMLAPDQSVTIELVMVAGAGVSEGRFINQALVRNALDNRALSAIATATVQIVPSPLFDCSEVIGKVFDDKNQDGYQDPGEDGLAGVRLVTAKGLIITTDEHGRYHITCAAVPNANIGSNFILKLDERSLPTGYRMTTENPRVVRLTRGKMTKANFGSSIMRVVTLDLSSEAFAGNTVRLSHDMVPHIGQLVGVLRQQESILRINYHDYENMGYLAEQRLNMVTGYLNDIWETQGCCYKLTIEQKLLSMEAQPTSYRPQPIRGGVGR